MLIGITLSAIESSLAEFKGEIQQKPPAYSALKHKGQPLYKLAREGKAVEPESRPATIYRLEIVGFDLPVLTLDVECSKGNYIRSLAHDLGEVLGCGAYLKSLVRTKYGPFDIKDALTLEFLEQVVTEGSLESLIQPLDTVLSLWEKVTLTDEQVEAVRCGVWQSLEVSPRGSRLRAYDNNSKLVALLTLDAEKQLWRPRKVFPQARSEVKNESHS